MQLELFKDMFHKIEWLENMRRAGLLKGN